MSLIYQSVQTLLLWNFTYIVRYDGKSTVQYKFADKSFVARTCVSFVALKARAPKFRRADVEICVARM